MTEEVKDTVQTADATPAVQETAEQTNVQTTVEQDLATVRAKKEELIAAGETLFKDEIASLEEKEKSLAAQIETEAEKVETEVVAVEKSFREKYGNEVLNSVEIIALAAIIWRLFF